MRNILIIITLCVNLCWGCQKEDPSIGTPYSFLQSDPVLYQNVLQVEGLEPAAHSAFTDMVEWDGKIFLTFREGINHQPSSPSEYGSIRILMSATGLHWENVGLITDEDYDLRDPKLSVTPDNRLMILYATINRQLQSGDKTINKVSFLQKEGESYIFTQPIPICHQDYMAQSSWLWRVTWCDDQAYGVSYSLSDEKRFLYTSYLLVSQDGIHYDRITTLMDHAEQGISEACVDFPEKDRMRVIARGGNAGNGYIGYSQKPYQEWIWYTLDVMLCGPVVYKLSDGTTLIAARSYIETTPYIMLYKLTSENTLTCIDQFERTGDDMGYPSIIEQDGRLLISYYTDFSDYGNPYSYICLKALDLSLLSNL